MQQKSVLDRIRYMEEVTQSFICPFGDLSSVPEVFRADAEKTYATYEVNLRDSLAYMKHFTNTYLQHRLKNEKSSKEGLLKNDPFAVQDEIRSKLMLFLPTFGDTELPDMGLIQPLATPSHTGSLEQLGFNSKVLGANDVSCFSMDDVKLVLKWLMPYFDHVRNNLEKYVPPSKLRLPLTANMGYPIITKLPEEAAKAYLIYLGYVVHEIRRGSYSMAEFVAMLSRSFGPEYTVPFTRLQGKFGPLVATDAYYRKYLQHNVEPRTRAVRGAPKYYAVANQVNRKIMTAAFLSCPRHDTRIPSTESWIKDKLSKGLTLYALDASKFDLNNGGRKLDLFVSVLADLVRANPSDREMLLLEARVPQVDFYRGQSYVLDAHARALASGMSTTTPLNLIAINMYFALCCRRHGLTADVDFHFKNWGDDMLVATTSDVMEKIQETFAFANLPTEFEDRTQFLGMYWNGHKLQYNTVSLTRKMLYPERAARNQWAARIGVCARLDLVHDPERWFAALARIWDDRKYGLPFAYHQRKAVMAEAARKVSSSDLRDVLYSAYAGMDPSDVMTQMAGDPFVDAIAASLSDFGADIDEIGGFAYEDPEEIRRMGASTMAEIRASVASNSPAFLLNLIRTVGLRYAPGNPAF